MLAIRELLANIAYFTDDLDTAATEYEAALALKIARNGPVHSSVALSQGNLGTVAFKRGDFVEAERRYRQSAETFRAFYGVDNDQVAAQLRNLALALRRLQRHDESLAMGRQALAILAEWSGSEHPQSLQTAMDLLEQEVLLRRDATATWAAIDTASGKLSATSRLGCRLTSLRQWVAETPSPSLAREARDCLLADHASEPLVLMAELSVARAEMLNGGDAAKVADAVRELQERLDSTDHPDPLMRAAAGALRTQMTTR